MFVENVNLQLNTGLKPFIKLIKFPRMNSNEMRNDV